MQRTKNNHKMMKKGDIWISAVLYMALGVILLSVILAVGVPAINKARDKAAITQTKDVFVKLDQNIRDIYNEGPGSQRPIQISIGRGELKIDDDAEEISWSIESQALISEPGKTITEGNLIIITNTTSIQENYIVTLKLNYEGTLNLVYDGAGSFGGSKNFLFQNIGSNQTLVNIRVSEI